MTASPNLGSRINPIIARPPRRAFSFRRKAILVTNLETRIYSYRTAQGKTVLLCQRVGGSETGL